MMNEYDVFYKMKHDRADAERRRRHQAWIEAAAAPKPRRRWWRLFVRPRLPSMKSPQPTEPCPDTILSAR